LIDSEENKIGWRRGLSAFSPEQILKALFTAPRRRNKWDIREKMTEHNHAGPKKADESEDQETMTPKPVHGGGI
jgi:hypothetical protein